MAKTKTPAKADPRKKIGFFTNLPRSTVEKIKKRSSKKYPQWRVVDDAVNGRKAPKVK